MSFGRVEYSISLGTTFFFLQRYGTFSFSLASIFMVSEQLNLSGIGLSAPRPTTSHPGGPMFSVGLSPLADQSLF
jgi:hypothetical protein